MQRLTELMSAISITLLSTLLNFPPVSTQGEVYIRNGSFLTSIPADIPITVTDIDLYNNSISIVGARAFSNFTLLNYLNLAFNYLSEIHPTAFQDTVIQDLELSDNYLTVVPYLGYIGPYLEQLQLWNNRLTAIPSGTFQNVTGLKELYLGANGNLSWSDMAGIEEVSGTLEYLNLYHTKGSHLNESIVVNYTLPNIIAIHMSYCMFSVFPVYFMQGQSVGWLYLNGNDLGDEDLLNSGMDTITVTHFLDLEYNNLNTFPDLSIATRDQIRKLRLKSNNISSVPYERLTGYTRINHLLLGDNQLTSIPPFPNIEVKRLVLSSNLIQYITAPVFTNLTQLEKLDLSNNPIMTVADISGYIIANGLSLDLRNIQFDCDCNFVFMLNGTSLYDSLSPGLIQLAPEPCHTPESMIGVNYSNISFTDICAVNATDNETGVECDPFPTWKELRTASSSHSPGENISYWCKTWYTFGDGDVNKTSVCAASTGEWMPELSSCSEMIASDSSALSSPVESKNAEVIGSFSVFIIIGMVAFIIILDSSHITTIVKQLRRCRKNVKSRVRPKEDTGDKDLLFTKTIKK